ncbi:MAG TPA: CDP-alcohol phosphatidyltransferase family protein [Kofleriaceae bacterium]|jgi:archaetidylinositol phosphate synthase
MNLFAIRKHVDRLLYPVVASLAKLPLHANAWTLSGALVGLVGGVVLYYGYWWTGFVLLLARGLIDHIDGFKARNFNQRSTFGAVMDDVCDRWVLGIMYAGGCLNLSYDYPHVLIVLGFGITGSLTNVIIKLSIYAESQQDIWREKGKIGHPVDVVGLFGSAEFLIYYGFGVFFTALLHDPRPMLAGCWAVAIMSHVSLLQRVRFAWKRYRFVDPGLRGEDDEPAPAGPAGQPGMMTDAEAS